MKKLFILLFIVQSIFAYELDIITIFQGNIGSYSQLTTVPASLRFWSDLKVTKYFDFTAGIRAVSGRTKLGGWGELVPINDVAFTNDHGIELDRAYLLCRLSDRAELILGLVDIAQYGSRKQGLAYSSAIGSEISGFTSTHFLRPLALASLEQQYFKSIPILSFDLWFSRYFNMRNYVTFGSTTAHIFFRNTWGIEFNFTPWRSGNYILHLGFVDNEFSYSHHISPSIMAGFDQKLVGNTGLFARYSWVEKFRLTGKPYVADFFTDINKHYLAGIFIASGGEILEETKHFLGAGLSGIESIYGPLRETVAEVFYRLKFNDRMTLTPDFQLIFNPGGNKEKLLYVWAIRFTCRMEWT